MKLLVWTNIIMLIWMAGLLCLKGIYHIKSWCSSVVEQLICNQPVGGSNPFASSFSMMGRWLSGQKQQTVNLPAYAYAGSNPALPKYRGSSSVG